MREGLSEIGFSCSVPFSVEEVSKFVVLTSLSFQSGAIGALAYRKARNGVSNIRVEDGTAADGRCLKGVEWAHAGLDQVNRRGPVPFKQRRLFRAHHSFLSASA
jgi:hypothetical protein